MALFILFAFLIGLVGSVVVGTPGLLMLRSGLQSYTRSQRLTLITLCGIGAIASLFITASWSLLQLQTITPPDSGAPTPEDAAALLKAGIAFGLTPGLSCLAAGLVSLTCSRN
jgi:hypothetical protein